MISDWDRLAEKHPKREANKHFVKILLLGRRYSNKDLLEAVEKALKYGAIEHSAVENILRQLGQKEVTFNKEELNMSLKSIDIQSFEFDISSYAELCKEVLL